MDYCSWIYCCNNSFILVESDFSSLAFDSGSVVTGTMIASFILPLIICIASGLGRDPQKDAFGVVGTVALTPILIMLILGVLVRKEIKNKMLEFLNLF